MIPIGLVLNELVTNALKYAWPDGRSGALTVNMRQDGEVLKLLVADDGVGDTSTVGDERASGFGLNMVRTFATKLKAEHTLQHADGTQVELIIRNFKLAR